MDVPLPVGTNAAALLLPKAAVSQSGEGPRLTEFQPEGVLQALPAAVYTTDAAGAITFYNEAAATLWGVRPEIGKSEFCGSWRLFWPDGRPMRYDECPMAIALKEKRAIRGAEAIAERPDGTRVPFLAYPTPLFDGSDELTGAVNTLIDITVRKNAEEAWQRLGAIVETTNDAIIGIDLNAIITTWNCAAERLFGYTAGEIIGKPVTILIPTDRHSEEIAILNKIRKGESVDHFDTVRRRRDGSVLDVSLAVSPIKDAQGRIIGASKIARDISEHKRAQNALAASEQRFRSLFALAPMAVFVCDRSGVIQAYNERAARLWGRRPICGDPNEMYCGSLRLRLPGGEVLPHDRSPLVDVLRTGEGRENVEVIIEREDGSQILVLVNFAPLKNTWGEVTGAITSFIDISERKRAQEQQRLLFREMNHRVKNLFTLAGTMVTLSARYTATSRELADAVSERLVALARAHDLTLPDITDAEKSFGRSTTLLDLAQTVLAPYQTQGDAPVSINGPDVPVAGKAAMGVALLLHEMATNAAKYGALTSEMGRVAVSWQITGDELKFEWRERGGPPIERRPDYEGFGSLLARLTVTGRLQGKISHDWSPEGLTVGFSAPLAELLH